MTQKIHLLVTCIAVFLCGYFYSSLQEARQWNANELTWAGAFLECSSELSELQARFTMDTLYFSDSTTITRRLSDDP